MLDTGLGNHFNILSHESDGTGSGVPVHLVAKRIVDESSSVDEAIAIAQSASVEASTVITVVSRGQDGDQAACLELSPEGIAVLYAERAQPLIHTNHFLDSELAARERPDPVSTTHDRYDCALRISDAVMNIAEPLQRAKAFTATDEPVDMKVDASKPWHQQMRTKATIVLDVEHNRIHYCAGSAYEPPKISGTHYRRR